MKSTMKDEGSRLLAVETGDSELKPLYSARLSGDGVGLIDVSATKSGIPFCSTEIVRACDQ